MFEKTRIEKLADIFKIVITFFKTDIDLSFSSKVRDEISLLLDLGERKKCLFHSRFNSIIDLKQQNVKYNVHAFIYKSQLIVKCIAEFFQLRLLL